MSDALEEGNVISSEAAREEVDRIRRIVAKKRSPEESHHFC